MSCVPVSGHSSCGPLTTLLSSLCTARPVADHHWPNKTVTAPLYCCDSACVCPKRESRVRACGQSTTTCWHRHTTTRVVSLPNTAPPLSAAGHNAATSCVIVRWSPPSPLHSLSATLTERSFASCAPSMFCRSGVQTPKLNILCPIFGLTQYIAAVFAPR